MENIVIIKSTFDNNNKITNLFPIFPKNENKNIIYNYGIGLLFINKDKVYVLTCFHSVKNTYDQEIFTLNKSYKGKISYESDELDLVLILVDMNDIDKEQYNKFNLFDLNFDLNLNITDKNLKIFTYDLNNFIKKKIIKFEEINCTFNEIKFDNLTSKNIPQIPYINLQLNKKKINDISNLKGLSGSILMSNNKIAGIITNTNLIDNFIICLPAILIERFLNEINKYNSFEGLCTLVGDFTLCDFNLNERIFGIYVNNTFDINYNNFKLNRNDNILAMNLKNHDIIYEIDGKKIDFNGNIYDNKCYINLHFKIYIAINFMCGDMIPCSIMRSKKSKENNDYRDKKINIKARPLNTMKYIPITFKNHILQYCGLIFCELSEDIIDAYRNMGINIGLYFSKYYLINQFRNDNEKIIILLDLKRNIISKDLLKIINNIGIPLIKISNWTDNSPVGLSNSIGKSIDFKGNNYAIPVLTKINKKKVMSLENLNQMIILEPELQMYFIIHNEKKIRISIKHNKMESIKIDN